tara:strand:- start:1213 stop:1524 length:312 start_codon:yes stop_codon:yes gene_type:complete
MKKIETLVEDIYKLFNFSRIDKDEKEVDALIDNFGEMLKVHVKEFMYSEPRGNGYLRLSAIGKPTRQIWYDINTETEEKYPQAHALNFYMDIFLKNFYYSVHP